ncbi:MAG: hypothetical protein E7426_02215 [Ruminococcaceae bacterium]|jgi:hypothetical protein|nr:hypothetical protein [Oscillospiraceae bacterium]
MILEIYKKALSVLMKKPLKLWGISLLCILLTGIGSALFGIIPGVALCISILLETSMTLIYLHGYRGEEVETLRLFDCFRDWKTIKRVLCGMGWMMLWIFIWGLIPVVGWIIAIVRTYEYRLTPYILMMEPDVKPTEAIKLSSARTEGWKGKMFGADILIYVLFAAAALILSLFARIRFIGVLFALVLFVLTICFFVLVPLFRGLVQSAFYEEICGNAAAPISEEEYADLVGKFQLDAEEPAAPEEPETPKEPENKDE